MFGSQFGFRDLFINGKNTQHYWELNSPFEIRFVYRLRYRLESTG